MCLGYLPFCLALSAAAPAEAPLAKAAEPDEEDLRALIEGAGTAADRDGADAVLVFDRSAVQVEDSGLSHYRRRRLFKVLTEGGATLLSTLRFDYDPTSNMVEVERARIYPRVQKNGQKEAPAPEPVDLGPEHISDLPQPQHWIYWGPRMQVLSVPRLEVGDALEVETYTKGFIIAYLGGGDGAGAGNGDPGNSDSAEEKFIPPMRGHFYDVVLFGDAALPTLERRYEVTLPRDKRLQYEVYNDEVFGSVTFAADTTTYAFWKKKLPAHKPEPHAADASDYLPKVVMATVADWQSKSPRRRWWCRRVSCSSVSPSTRKSRPPRARCEPA